MQKEIPSTSADTTNHDGINSVRIAYASDFLQDCFVN